MLWQKIIRPTLFRMDAERAHYFAMGTFSCIGQIPGVASLAVGGHLKEDPRLNVQCLGQRFANPFVLAAGFDKNAKWFNVLHRLGFSAIEVGTITGHAQPGNDRPRLFRMPVDGALLNRMGFNNDGAEAVADRIAKSTIKPILGINIGMSKVTPLSDAPEDYLVSFERLAPFADYITINVSSPNTPGLRSLQDREPLSRLLQILQERNRELAIERSEHRIPILLKIAPDLTETALDEVADLALDHGLDGIIATNTTLSRVGLKTKADIVEQLGNGGVSGAPLTMRSRTYVARLFKRVGHKLPIIGSGGIMSDDDAWEMMRAGASLVQIYSGFVYGGPRFVRSLAHSFVRRLDERGLDSISAIVGENDQLADS